MPILDFKEIPPAKGGGEQPETFELFARDVLEFLGYKVVSGPDRGQDGGRDIILVEVRRGVGGESSVRWLVSCKHKAHSNQAVTVDDEKDIRDRVESHKCNGFLGFYSTVPSAPLTKKLEGMGDHVEHQFFDPEKIERSLLGSVGGLKIADRYFPRSAQQWKIENPKPARLLDPAAALQCEYCKKNLLEPERTGNILIWEDLEMLRQKTPHILRVYWCCKGDCDRILQRRYWKSELSDGWEDIRDVAIPTVYLKWVMATFNQFHAGTRFTDEAFESLKLFMMALFPYVSRQLTTEEQETMKGLLVLPSFLGGFG